MLIRLSIAAADVKDLYTDENGNVLPGFTTIANNLPGYMQYVSLIRDCIEAFGGLPALPPNVTETEHPLHGYNGRDYRYADYDSKHHMRDQVSKPWSASLQLFQREAATARRRAKVKAEKEAWDQAKRVAEVESDKTKELPGATSQMSDRAKATTEREHEAQVESSGLAEPASDGPDNGSGSTLESRGTCPRCHQGFTDGYCFCS